MNAQGLAPRITVELYGVPRLRAGRAAVAVEAATVGAALDGLRRDCPGLDGPVIAGQGLNGAYKLSLNGERFVSEPDTPLAVGDVLLLLSADVGG